MTLILPISSFRNFPLITRMTLIGTLAIIAFLSQPRVSATPPGQLARATLTFADGHSIQLRGRDRFRVIPLSAGEMIMIDAQLPAQAAGLPAFAQPLDGGLASEVVIAADGTTSINFQVGVEPGLYRLLLGVSGRTAILQFQVPASPGQ